MNARRWLLLAVAAGLLARIVRYAAHFPIWGDEAFVAVNFFQRDWAGLLRTLEHDMVAPIGWLWATLATSKLLGCGELALRLPAFLAGLATLLLFVPLARKTLPRTSALCAVALLAASYYPMRHAAEVKPYATDLLVALPLYALGLRLLREPERAASWLLLAGFGALAIWCSYTAAFVAGGVLLVTGATVVRERARGRERSGRLVLLWLAAAAAIAASFIAMYLAVGRAQQWSDATISDSRTWNDHFPPLSQPWLVPWWLVKELTGNMLAYPNGGRDFGCAATTLLVGVGAVALWRGGRRRVALLLLSPLAPMFLAAALRKYPFGGSARTTLHLALPVCLLAGHGFVALLRTCPWPNLRPRVALRCARGFVALMAALALGGVVRDVVQPWKTEADVRTRNAVQALRERTHAGDRWIVFGAFVDVPHAPNMISWRGSSARIEYHLLHAAGAAGATLAWAPPVAAIDPDYAGRTWLLAYRDNEAAFPDELWIAYRNAIAARLQSAGEESTLVVGPASPDPRTGADRLEALTLVRFEP